MNRPGTLLAVGTIALLAGAVAGPGFHGGPARGATVTSPGDAANALVARSDAASLLGRVRLPPGATSSPVEPAGDAGVLAHPGLVPATPNLVDDRAWWTVAASAQSVLAFVTGAPPAGSTLVYQGGGSGPGTPGFSLVGFGWPAVTNVLEGQELIVEIVRLGDGTTGVRADAQVVWITTRPASEHIPAGARRLWVTVSGGVGPPGARPQPARPILVTSSAKIRRVVALLNRLPAYQPGVSPCPVDTGGVVQLAFYRRRGAAALAVARIDPGGCGAVRLSIDGRGQPTLASEWFPGSGLASRSSLIAKLDATLMVGLSP